MRLWVFLSLLFLASCGGGETESNLNLIGGRPANAGEFPEVVRIITSNSACTATIIGPRVILTAAHCGQTGQISRFRINGVNFSARLTRAPGFPQINRDVALGFVNNDMPIRPAKIGGSARIGNIVTFAGFGATQIGGGGGNDGILRVGNARIIRLSGFDLITKDVVALGFGDSGGPAFIPGTKNVIGVNSRGNIRDTSFDIRTDLASIRQFFQTFARENNVIICGVNSQC